jgi:hypothetical protein
MSIGADERRGNGDFLGALNNPIKPSFLYFTSRLWDYWQPSIQLGHIYTHMVYVISRWGGEDKMVFINLHSANTDYGGPSGDGLARLWSWPIQDSFLYPGADIAFFDIERLADRCPDAVIGYDERLVQIGEERNYAFDLTEVFLCADSFGHFRSTNPMPTYEVPIVGVHWANEAFGNTSVIWTSVHNMQMLVPSRQHEFSVRSGLDRSTLSQRLTAGLNERPAHPETGNMGPDLELARDLLIQSCLRQPQCSEKYGENMLKGTRDPIYPRESWPSRAAREPVIHRGRPLQ